MASVWLYVWTDVRLDRGILCALWAIRQFYINASFIVIILWVGGVDKWHYLAGEMDDLLSGSCFRLSYLHADEFDKSWSCHGLVVFVFWPFICGNDDYSRAYS